MKRSGIGQRKTPRTTSRSAPTSKTLPRRLQGIVVARPCVRPSAASVVAPAVAETPRYTRPRGRSFTRAPELASVVAQHGILTAEQLDARACVKRKPTRSTKYLAFVRRHACCVCNHGAGPHEIHAHHFPTKGAGASDLETVPLCVVHHTQFHAHGTIASEDGRLWTRSKLFAVFCAAQVKLLVEWLETEVADALAR